MVHVWVPVTVESFDLQFKFRFFQRILLKIQLSYEWYHMINCYWVIHNALNVTTRSNWMRILSTQSKKIAHIRTSRKAKTSPFSSNAWDSLNAPHYSSNVSGRKCVRATSLSKHNLIDGINLIRFLHFSKETPSRHGCNWVTTMRFPFIKVKKKKDLVIPKCLSCLSLSWHREYSSTIMTTRVRIMTTEWNARARCNGI